MATYVWQGNVLTIDSEVEAIGKVEVDLDKLSEPVKQAALKFGLKTALRNSTAGKMDDPAEGFKALKAKLAVFQSGVWEAEGEAKVKVGLTDDERLKILREVLVMARRAKGDKRTDAEIVTAFSELSEQRQADVLAALKTAIAKREKQALAEKKKLAKVNTEY